MHAAVLNDIPNWHATCFVLSPPPPQRIRRTHHSPVSGTGRTIHSARDRMGHLGDSYVKQNVTRLFAHRAMDKSMIDGINAVIGKMHPHPFEYCRLRFHGYQVIMASRDCAALWHGQLAPPIGQTPRQGQSLCTIPERPTRIPVRRSIRNKTHQMPETVPGR